MMYIHPSRIGPVVVPAGGKEGQDVPKGTLNSILKTGGSQMNQSIKSNRAYAFVIERAEDGLYWAYLPDLPGCATSAATPEEVERQLPEAVGLYLSYYADRQLDPPALVARVGTLAA